MTKLVFSGGIFSLVIFSMIFQSLTFIGLFDDYNANKVNTMSTWIDWYWSLVLNGVITISIAARSLEIRRPQQSVTLFLIRREYENGNFHYDKVSYQWQKRADDDRQHRQTTASNQQSTNLCQ